MEDTTAKAIVIGILILIGALIKALFKKINIKIKNPNLFSIILWCIGMGSGYWGYLLYEKHSVFLLSYLLLAIGAILLIVSGSVFFHTLFNPPPQTKSFSGQNEPTKMEEFISSMTESILHNISKSIGLKKFAIWFIPFIVVVIAAVTILSNNFLHISNYLPTDSFKNEPDGFRNMHFKDSTNEFLRLYPNAKKMQGNVPKNLEIYFVINERFWDWDDITIRFIFYKDRLYSVAIDYTPLAVGKDFDAIAAESAADQLMLSRTEKHYGIPEIQTKNGNKFQIWRGRKSGVTLDQQNNVLALIDSQLLLEYQSETKGYSP